MASRFTALQMQGAHQLKTPSKNPNKYVQSMYHPAVPLTRKGLAEVPTQPHYTSYSTAITEARTLQHRYAPPIVAACPPSLLGLNHLDLANTYSTIGVVHSAHLLRHAKHERSDGLSI